MYVLAIKVNQLLNAPLRSGLGVPGELVKTLLKRHESIVVRQTKTVKVV